MTPTLRHDPGLAAHLIAWKDPDDPDGPTLGEVFFPDGRLAYPTRSEVEDFLGFPEPYTISYEARVFQGLPRRMVTAVRMLCREVRDRRMVDGDPGLGMLWGAHQDYLDAHGVLTPDRLVAALVAVYELSEGDWRDQYLDEAAVTLVAEMHSIGMPPTRKMFSEMIEPACVMLGLVEV